MLTSYKESYKVQDAFLLTITHLQLYEQLCDIAMHYAEHKEEEDKGRSRASNFSCQLIKDYHSRTTICRYL